MGATRPDRTYISGGVKRLSKKKDKPQDNVDHLWLSSVIRPEYGR